MKGYALVGLLGKQQLEQNDFDGCGRNGPKWTEWTEWTT
jgi:hypothetical protein